MMHKTYELVCPLSAQAALERIKALLSKKCVKYRADNLSVTSTQTPLVVVNVDPRGISRSNWVGLNPFMYVSSVEVQCQPADHGLTKVIVRVDRFRALIWVGCSIALGALVASAFPVWAGLLVLVAFTSAMWFRTVSLGGYLIRKEISDHLKLAEYRSRWYILGVRGGSWLMSWRKSATKPSNRSHRRD